MPNADDRKYFIVKHDLESLQTLPNYVWRSDKGRDEVPHRFNEINRGDRWVAFAYTSNDANERPLSLVTGFFECVEPRHYRRVPEGLAIDGDGWSKRGFAWMIEGKPCGKQPRQPVGVPPISDLLSPKRVWNNQAIIPITAPSFDHIRKTTLSLQFNTSRIPLLRREPTCEQELLGAVVYGHRKLGIKSILRIRKAFPDLLVTIEGKPEPVHLELEIYSEGFFAHGHHQYVRNGRFKDDGKPVVVLCWIDNDDRVKDHVCRVFELQSLIRAGKKIVW